MPKRKVLVKVKLDAYAVVSDALAYAAQRACDRCDKYHEAQLTDGQRITLQQEFVNSFWIGMNDANAEVI